MPGFLTHWRILIETARELEQPNARETMLPTDAPTLTYPRLPSLAVGADIPTLAYLGALGPDVPYLGGSIFRSAFLGSRYKGKASGKSRWADALHYNRSGDYVFALLARLPHITSLTLQRKLLAYVFGYLTHIAGDVIVHPFVNSFAGAYHDQTDPQAFFNFGMHFWVEMCQDAATAKSLFHDDIARLINRRWGKYLSGALSELTATHEGSSLLTLLTEVATQVYGLTDADAADFASQYEEGTKALQRFLDGAGYYRLLYWSLRFQGDLSQRFVRQTGAPSAAGADAWEVTFDQVVRFACAVSKHLCSVSAGYVENQSVQSEGEDQQSRVAATLRQSLRNWDLDTGYAAEVGVGDNGSAIHILLQHSWYVFQEHRPLAGK